MQCRAKDKVQDEKAKRSEPLKSCIYIIPQTTLACGGSYLLGKEVESSGGVRAWWTLGLRLGLGVRAEGWG